MSSSMTNAEKNVVSLINGEIDSSAPQMVEVVETRGRMVRVRFPQESVAGESWFTSTAMPVDVGSSGLIVPMRGNASYFQPLGLDTDDRYYTQAEVDAMLSLKETRFYRTSGSPLTEDTTFVVSTFSQAKSLWLTTLEYVIPQASEGTWDVQMTASVTVYRSVTTGGVYVFPSIRGFSIFAVPRGFPQNSAYTIVRTLHLTGCVGTDELEVRYGGQGTVGVTTVRDWNIDITAVRTG